MLASEFTERVKSLGLPLSDALDLVAYIADITYESAKVAQSLTLDELKVDLVFARLNDFEPTAYITGRREFYGLEFAVDTNTLIPRVETEPLVEAALGFATGRKHVEILDICTGSGCILLSLLANMKNANGTGVDISGGALSVAEKNADLLGLSARCRLELGDISGWVPARRYDIVTCNPPYISESEYALLEAQVKHEPKLALTADDDGLFFYKKILSNLHIFCKKDGAIFFEIGYSQKSVLQEFAELNGIEHLFIKDYSGNDRVFVCYPSI